MRQLLIRPGAIGDCIVSFPALEYLSRRFTEIWAPSAVLPLIDFADSVLSISGTQLDLVGIGDLPMPENLRSRLRTFDRIVSWYGTNRPEFRDALQETGVPCTFHVALPPDNWIGHAVDFYALQAGAPLGLVPRIRLRQAVPRGTIVIHPFSGSTRKNWPLERFREFARRIPLPVEWTTGPEESLPEATRVEDLRDLANWLAGAEIYIGNDSGITHLAASTGIKTLALFNSSIVDRWAPRGENVRVLARETVQDLSVADVWEAVNQLLGASGTAVSSAQSVYGRQ